MTKAESDRRPGQQAWNAQGRGRKGRSTSCSTTSSAALKQGERVNISGFGTFSVSDRQPRTGRNPKTGESIEISASRSAKFKPGKQLKDSLNEEGAPAESASV